MSGAAPKTRPKIADGKSFMLITRQKEIKPGAFVGYDTIWEEFQKEIAYEVPKRP